ncbi:nucleotidyltransferase family protein [Yersinia similis]|uniref:nucleotidyltransferase family protein n=1 Tax=Yersinia similis TaxID=367190 RepID=UPI0011A42BCA|nr:nucleotidyltransferase family protein [Yersinia similis]
MDPHQQIIQWLRDDPYRMQALYAARELGLNQWCLAAGFVRNLVWDQLHGYLSPTPLNDIDLVYFDKKDISKQHDLQLEALLLHKQTAQKNRLPWSVKNQARMHLHSDRLPYTSTEDAISYWIEIETAIGARLTDKGDIELISPLGLAALFALTVTLNPKNGELTTFYQRVNSKSWLQHWPNLHVVP